MRNNTYDTKQKNSILNIIKNSKKDFTVKEVYNSLNNTIGLTTIYRLVDKLVQEGRLTKNIDENNTTYYHYLEECSHHNHFYLKCDNCGSLIHIDCDCIEDLYNHISKEHKFKLNKEKIIINGICSNCMKEC